MQTASQKPLFDSEAGKLRYLFTGSVAHLRVDLRVLTALHCRGCSCLRLSRFLSFRKSIKSEGREVLGSGQVLVAEWCQCARAAEAAAKGELKGSDLGTCCP